MHFITPSVFQYAAALPDHVRLSFVCMTLSHRINQASNNFQSRSLTRRFYHCRGLVIRSLNEDLTLDHRLKGDAIIAGIVGLLLLDNTTSPASDLRMTGSHLEDVEALVKRYGDRNFAFQMCPPSLFTKIVAINHLRWQATTVEATESHGLSKRAYNTLDSVDKFSPEEWAAAKPASSKKWTIIGRAFQAAVALYCISSLQSVSILPHSQSLRARCTAHGQLLYLLLKDALVDPPLKRAMLWPLALLGMEAVTGSATMRNFVKNQLTELSREFGTHVPLTTRGVLERFWESGETRWDSCFDKPYICAAQIAVDFGGLV
ncbi:uncharacterized protein A1O9_09645 [Exophiala aquamarina CBS 119918]|uniref:Transcription factor domain-containing protein n=1 Tax=Exophiala aquamarina CBS 119918 TaxID=1182545 RepID=A0A072P5B1_9EURO|nr:uncharacterized protein A1O9_09645 [Exophiala aquamarina CBS 119918]KEF54478.1 hypothetical protein A1O9_09645 [Exophiala aquamarina CBS 119918]